jgi:hypothetical protein
VTRLRKMMLEELQRRNYSEVPSAAICERRRQGTLYRRPYILRSGLREVSRSILWWSFGNPPLMDDGVVKDVGSNYLEELSIQMERSSCWFIWEAQKFMLRHA